MIQTKKAAAAALLALMIVGCVVREERPRHRIVVYDEDPAPQAPVEIIPAPPEPGVIWVQGVYVREDGHWRWHHGYWRR